MDKELGILRMEIMYKEYIVKQKKKLKKKDKNLYLN